jgi:outer membrane protein OmpA-like peptidoglycan-associated protein
VADKNALVVLGVAGRRLKTVSYGKERPSENDAAWARNRNAAMTKD